jgi:thioredoxin-like negative regulator of GroEL
VVYDAHVCLHPSRTGKDGNREGVPNAMLEAMASGVPVVATNHGGIPEAITHGVSGLLVEENDAPALAQAVLRLIQDASLRSSIAQAGREAQAGLAGFEARLAADPSDHEAAIELSIALNAMDERARAAETLLASIKLDRAWNEEAARMQLLKFFEAWGMTDPETIDARRRLSGILFS